MATASRLAASFTPRWLAAQRWFRAKQRAISAVTVTDRASLGAAHAELVVLEVAYTDGAMDHYLVLAVEEGGELREPRDGDGAWRTMVRLMAEGAELHAEHARVRLDATPVLDELLPSAREASAALEERRLGVEQTNTSVVLGERLILKLYRLLEPGVNPDLEVSAFLTDIGFPHTPPLAGSAHYLPEGGESCAALMLQALVPSRGDAWALVLSLVASPGDWPRASAAAERIGAISAQLHAALASRPDDAAFPARRATEDEIAAWEKAAQRGLTAALASLSGQARDRLEAMAPAIRERLATIGLARSVPVSRIHGDYHLGQLLAAPDGGFWIIDFEGEPARPLEERRQVTSPVRDVAGMLRSFDYAARTVDAGGWLVEARRAFLGAYGAIGPELVPLLAAFEVEKACYEVRYEANHRPDWIWLPLEALARLTA